MFGWFWFVSATATCQEQPSPTAQVPQQQPPQVVDPGLLEKLGSPQSTWRTFRDASTEEAILCFDLSDFTSDTVSAKGESWVYKLKGILERTGMYHVLLSHQPDDSSSSVSVLDYLPYATDLYATFSSEDLEDFRQIRLARNPDNLWRFTRETVDAIDPLWERWQNKPIATAAATVQSTEKPTAAKLRDAFPSRFHRRRFLLFDWQWICLAALVLLGFAADVLVRYVLRFLTAAWFRFVRTDAAFKAERRVWKPVGLLAQALVWYGGMLIVDLPAEVLQVLLAALKLFTFVAAIWMVFRFMDLFAHYLCRQASKTDTRLDDLLVPLFTKTIKLIAVGISALLFAEAYNLPYKGLIGGLGLGGAALAFASKDTISNLFGSFTVLIDRPFEIGDWIISDNVEGTVEVVGFRSTRVRTFYNSLITVPNNLFTTAIVDNMGQRRYRRIRTNLGVEYGTTPEQIEAFCEGIRELIRQHPYTRKDNYLVCFHQFSENSLDILVNCFLMLDDWQTEKEERQRFYLNILRLAAKLDVSFAFPTRTLHLYQEQPPGDDRALNYKDPHAVGRHEANRIADPNYRELGSDEDTA